MSAYKVSFCGPPALDCASRQSNVRGLSFCAGGEGDAGLCAGAGLLRISAGGYYAH
ncbi:hypothetical protein [Kamptonema formosum]|uniref:hypothetical protein n=1 Tax=Kamptonema formosum TaxID=331992 RepID=UPI0012DC3E8B|nr:hypothetical protein [Oscillatoria sp. PCC 10802]